MLQMIKRSENNGFGAPSQFVIQESVDISERVVGIFGSGSLGSHTAYALASRGVRRVIIADKDRLSQDNLRRHLCGREFVGKPKSAAVKSALQEHFRDLEVDAQQFCFRSETDRLRRLIQSCDAAVIAINSQGEGMKYPINDMLWTLRKPGVFTGLYGNGWGAELILVDASRFTSCYACAANMLGRFGYEVGSSSVPPAYTIGRPIVIPYGSAGGPPGIQRPAGDLRSLRSQPTNGWTEANLMSILPTAALTGELVIAVLEDQAGSKHLLSEFRTDDEASVWRLALRRVHEWDQGPWNLKPIPVSGSSACPLRCTVHQSRFVPAPAA